jgi:hypothetical protein
MSSHTTSRLGAASGIAYVLGVLCLNSLESNSHIVLGAEVVALLLFVPFLAYLCGHLRHADAADGWIVATAFGAGIVAIAVKLAGVLPAIIVAQGELTAPVAAAFTRFGDVSFMVSMMPLGVFLAAVATIVLRTRVLPLWFGWSAALIAPLLVANAFDLGSQFGPAFILFLLWTLIAAVILLRRAAGDVPRAIRVPAPSITS